MLTIEEAARILRIGRSLAYHLAGEYLATGGTSGMPVIRLSPQCLRVPRWALLELALTGRVVRLCDADASTGSTLPSDESHRSRLGHSKAPPRRREPD